MSEQDDSAREALRPELPDRTEELREAKRVAEEASRAKSDFLANMSHEIRTPLTAILGYTEILLDSEALSSSDRDSVHIIKSSGDHLLSLVNDILDFSKIEAGKMDVECVSVDLFWLVQDSVSPLTLNAKEKNLEFAVYYETPVPRMIYSDPVRIRQVLVNLIGNALKFTEKGLVRLCVGIEEDDAESPRLYFRVEDTGIGIAEEKVAKLFQVFSQADSSTTRHFGGTGLGLAISKSLSHLLGGDIEVESVSGQGSVFKFTVYPGSLDDVPRVTEAQRTQIQRNLTMRKMQGVAFEGRVLLVEDTPVNQMLICRMLEAVGLTVDIADNGAVGVEMASAAIESSEGYDVILMDVQMPVMDGLTATGKIRELGFEGKIIALTANAQSRDRQLCLRAGCSDFLTKPVNRDRLLELITEEIEESV